MKKLVLILFFASTLAAQPRGLEVYISADMEGIGGVVTDQQLSPQGFEYAKARELMTARRGDRGEHFLVRASRRRAHRRRVDARGRNHALIAGHFRVPVVMISGDDAAVAEARKIIGDIEGAVVKEAYGFHSAKTLTPEAARERVRETVLRALQNRARFKPLAVKSPSTLELRFKNYRPAEILAFLPNVERVDAHAVRFVGRDILEVARFLSFAANYEPGLEP